METHNSGGHTRVTHARNGINLMLTDEVNLTQRLLPTDITKLQGHRQGRNIGVGGRSPFMIKAIHLARIEGPTQSIFRELIVCKFSNLLKLQWTIVHIFMYMFSVSHDYPVHCMFSVYLSIIAAVIQL